MRRKRKDKKFNELIKLMLEKLNQGNENQLRNIIRAILYIEEHGIPDGFFTTDKEFGKIFNEVVIRIYL
ncbi:MAG TPA: hypothetical protein GYA04_01065 [Acholeplasma sp.]|nr:hypothetical protein [Acholeplasma sp.]